MHDNPSVTGIRFLCLLPTSLLPALTFDNAEMPTYNAPAFRRVPPYALIKREGRIIPLHLSRRDR